MSDLAYDLNGDPIALPASAASWRVRYFPNPGTRGAPQVVLDKDGKPLVLPIDTTFVEFRDAVAGRSGRYRLDPLDERGRVVQGVAAAYITLTEPPRNGAAGVADDTEDDTALREVIRSNNDLARTNADIVKTITDRFAGVMQAAAEVIRAADGAGIVARQPVIPPEPTDRPPDDADLGDDDDDELEEAGPPTFAELVGQVMPMLKTFFEIKMNQSASAAATPRAPAARARAVPPPTTLEGAPATSPQHETSAAEPARNAAAPTPAQMMRLMAIQKLLTPDEAEVARATAAELSAEDRAELLTELEALSIDDGAALIRSMLPDLSSAQESAS